MGRHYLFDLTMSGGHVVSVAVVLDFIIQLLCILCFVFAVQVVGELFAVHLERFVI